MTDREMLDLAAKAAGYSIDKRASFMTWRDSRRLALLNSQGGHTLWNADEDDGDALRLAVKLQLRVIPPEDEFGLDRASVRIAGHRDLIDAYDDSDPYAATRRAIVCAAATICQAKESK